MQFGETFYMLITNVFCKESVSTAQVVANTRVESIDLILFVSRSIPHPSVILRLLPGSLKTCVKASFFKHCHCYYIWQLILVLLTVTFILYYSCYCSAHLGYWHMCITVVQLASPAIHNNDNSHIF